VFLSAKNSASSVFYSRKLFLPNPQVGGGCSQVATFLKFILYGHKCRSRKLRRKRKEEARAQAEGASAKIPLYVPFE